MFFKKKCEHQLVNVTLDSGVVAKVCTKCYDAFYINHVPVLTELPKKEAKEAVEKIKKLYK
jgi:hypothetical protein